MHRVFISDLHLYPNMCENSKLLENFLNKNHNTIDELYILGDLFNFWIGDDVHLDEYKDIIKILYEFNKPNKRTFLMYGNRDFLFGKEFFAKTNITWINDPYFLSIHSNKIMLTHGDLIFDKSALYQIYRRTCLFLNSSSVIRKMFFRLPKNIRKKIANILRGEQSDYKHFQLDLNNAEDFIEKLSKQDVDIFIHGHTHVPTIQLLQLNRKCIYRYTLSDWHEGTGCIIEATDNEPLRMRYFSTSSHQED